MAAGDPYFNCDNGNLSLEQSIRLMIYDDGAGNPVINLSQGGSILQKWDDCHKNKISTEQLLRLLIVQDEFGEPVFNVAIT